MSDEASEPKQVCQDCGGKTNRNAVLCGKCVNKLMFSDDKEREHINNQGEFQSDKYPWCEAGFVPLKLTDSNARIVLATYAELRRPIDPQFADDLLWAIKKAESETKK